MFYKTLMMPYSQVYFVSARTPTEPLMLSIPEAEKNGYVNQRGLSRKHIFDSVKASLKRLDLEYIDVLQCHRFDVDTPIEETVRVCTSRVWVCTHD